MLLLAGILMNQRSLLALSPLQTKIVWGGLTSLLITMAAECINAFWYERSPRILRTTSVLHCTYPAQ